MRAEGVVARTHEKAEYAADPPLPCRASPPQVGRSAKGTLSAQHHPSGEGKINENSIAPPHHSRCPVSARLANLPT
ncbi:hypothetical protein DSM25559_1906 [Agrobacterium rosae]|uniref:Uncharacterized protein n=1 Tax=Agrobacterium rosae TaxID=1972867 RepID=A0A1R3TJ87_9HYPH|nr:hypothetical protein DSM25559_1906 [Agrobacterium rosae]